MKKILLVCYLLLSSSVFWAQKTPIDFSRNEDIFNAFDGSGFGKRGNPIDGSDIVGEFFNNGASAWQGFLINLERPIDLDVQKVITLDFYQFDPNAHTLMVRLEQGGEKPDIEVSRNINAGNANTWQNNLQFDFSNAQLSGASGNTVGSGQYNRLLLFIDGGSNTAGTYLIDDINDGSEDDPHELDIVYNDLVWSDEFDKNGAIDNENWHHQTFGPNGGRWFNGEQQHYTDRTTNSFVDNGFLNIIAKKETRTQNGVTLNYTSARLNSKFAFRYGRVDVRAKLPEGGGTWPAIWTLGKNISEPGAWFQTQGFGDTPWPACGELDIMEHGLHGLNEVSAAVHTTAASAGSAPVGTKQLTDVANNFHVYSMNWSPGQITFLIDGEGFFTYKPSPQTNANWPFNQEQFLLLNIAMGGNGGAIDPNFTEGRMEIDYVRVYQNTTASTEDVFASKYSLYPNPASSDVYVKSNEIVDALEVYNMLGQKVIAKKNTKNLVVSELESGMYLIHIYSQGKRVVKKFIKE